MFSFLTSWSCLLTYYS